MLLFLDYRRDSEVEAYSTEILKHPDDVLGLYGMWTANAGMAYVKFKRGDSGVVFLPIKKRPTTPPRRMGWPHHRGPLEL